VQFDDFLGAGHGAYGSGPFEAIRKGRVDTTYPELGTGVNPSDLDHWQDDREEPWSSDLASTDAGNYRWSGNPLFSWVANATFYGQPQFSSTTLEVTQGSWPNDDGSGISNYPQDYYGFLLCVFENGMPDDIGEAMEWMKAEWTAGNKAIWSGWSTL
jgi:hypothetical protein